MKSVICFLPFVAGQDLGALDNALAAAGAGDAADLLAAAGAGDAAGLLAAAGAGDAAALLDAAGAGDVAGAAAAAEAAAAAALAAAGVGSEVECKPCLREELFTPDEMTIADTPQKCSDNWKVCEMAFGACKTAATAARDSLPIEGKEKIDICHMVQMGPTSSGCCGKQGTNVDAANAELFAETLINAKITGTDWTLDDICDDKGIDTEARFELGDNSYTTCTAGFGSCMSGMNPVCSQLETVRAGAAQFKCCKGSVKTGAAQGGFTTTNVVGGSSSGSGSDSNAFASSVSFGALVLAFFAMRV